LRIVDDLRTEGFIMDAERRWGENQYTYPAPTEKGWTRLAEGRWFSDTDETTDAHDS